MSEATPTLAPKRIVVVGSAGDAQRDPNNAHTWLPAVGSLFTYSLDDDGGLTHMDGPVTAGVMPMWITQWTVNGNTFVYSADMTKDEFGIRVWALDTTKGTLTFVNKAATGGGPCHFTVVSKNEKSYMIAAHYEGGGISAHLLSNDGSIGDASFSNVHPAGKLAHGRQDAPHPHGITSNKDWIYVPDLGKNLIYQYSLDFDKGTLTEVSTTSVHESAGPRHIVFGANNDAYAINELDNTVTKFGVEPNSGVLTVVKHVSSLPEGWDAPKPFEFYDAPSHAAEILMSSSGDRLFVTNRGHDSIAMLNTDLELVGTTPSSGSIPWTLADGGDDLFVVTNQFNHARKDPGNLAVFRKVNDTFEFVGTKGFITHPKTVCACVVTV
eukprot:m.49930 g.49930  ORF g.49930 m.49930 type:complete len:381 (-) comp21162_c1_seq2:154-1296(-)